MTEEEEGKDLIKNTRLLVGKELDELLVVTDCVNGLDMFGSECVVVS